MSKNIPWYVDGLHFECTGCGDCCSGPDEGYIWVTKPEIEFIAEFLKTTVTELNKNYLRRIGKRRSIIEHARTKDCIFLETKNNQKTCRIYPVRPNQCRTWPFWTHNLCHADAFNSETQDCPGVHRGRKYSRKEIDKLKKQTKWWTIDKPKKNS